MPAVPKELQLCHTMQTDNCYQALESFACNIVLSNLLFASLDTGSLRESS